MKDLFTRLIREEDASLDMWITVIVFLLITVACYIIIWKKFGNQATQDATKQVASSMTEILGGANSAQNQTIGGT